MRDLIMISISTSYNLRMHINRAETNFEFYLDRKTSFLLLKLLYHIRSAVNFITERSSDAQSMPGN